MFHECIASECKSPPDRLIIVAVSVFSSSSIEVSLFFILIMAWSQQSWGWSDSRNEWNQSWYGAQRCASSDYRSAATSPPSNSQPTWAPPASSSAPAPVWPSTFVSDDHHYDTTSVFCFSFKKEVEATHWSRKKGFSSRDVMDIRAHELLFHGPAEWALRLLSHGRFVSVVPTRSVAESIPVSKLFDSTQLFQPAIDMMISSIASFAPTQQGAAASQNLLKLETELGKRKQQLRQQGVMLTPEKPATKSADPASSSEQKPGSHAVPIAGQQPSQQSSQQPELDYIPEDALSSHVKKLQGQFFCSTVMGENVQEPWEPTSMLSLKSLQWKSLLRLRMLTTS